MILYRTILTYVWYPAEVQARGSNLSLHGRRHHRAVFATGGTVAAAVAVAAVRNHNCHRI